MTAHPDILERKDGLRTSFVGSLLFHVSVFGALIGASLISTTHSEKWGYQNALNGGSVSVTPVGIPLPRTTARVNPVASDSESDVPPEPVKEKRAKREKVERDDPDAISLKSKRSKKKTKERPAETSRYIPKEVYKSNQVYSTIPQAVSSPLYSGTPGTGIGIGNGNPFGNRFGAYADMLRRRISEKWRTNEIDPRIKTSPPAVVMFEIMRNGTIRNVQLKERSGILPLDYSAQRAVQEAAPFEPLPREYERDSAVIELSFHLKR